MKWDFFDIKSIFFEIDQKFFFELQHFKVTPPLNDHIDISRQVAQILAKLIPGQYNLEETKSIQATAPDLGPVGLWSPNPVPSAVVTPLLPRTRSASGVK